MAGFHVISGARHDVHVIGLGNSYQGSDDSTKAFYRRIDDRTPSGSPITPEFACGYLLFINYGVVAIAKPVLSDPPQILRGNGNFAHRLRFAIVPKFEFWDAPVLREQRLDAEHMVVRHSDARVARRNGVSHSIHIVQQLTCRTLIDAQATAFISKRKRNATADALFGGGRRCA